MSALTSVPFYLVPVSKILKVLVALITKNYFGLSYLDDDIPYIYFCILFAFGFIVQHGFGLLEKKEIKKMEARLEKIREEAKINEQNNNNNNNNNNDDDDDDVFYDALDTFDSSQELSLASSDSPPLEDTQMKEINK